MLGAKWTDRGRQQAIVVISAFVIAVVIGVTIGLLDFIDRQLKQDSEQQVVTSTSHAASGVAERMNAVRCAIESFEVQSSDPADVMDALKSLEQNYGFSDAAFAGLDGSGMHADGSAFSTSSLSVEETALSSRTSSYALCPDEGLGRLGVAQRPLSIGGQAVGALYVQVSLNTLISSAQSDMLGDQSTFFIVESASGDILTQPAGTGSLSADTQTLYTFLDVARAVPPDDAFDPSGLLLLLREGAVTKGLDDVGSIVESGDAGLVIGSIDGKTSYLCVAPIDQGEWYACAVIPIRDARAGAWDVMAAIQVVFLIVLLCLIGVALLAFFLYRRHVREKNVATFSQLYKALSETLEMAVNLYSPTDHAVTPIVAKSADIVGRSMKELLAGNGHLDELGISDEGRQLLDRIRAGDIEGIEQGEFSLVDLTRGRKRWISYAVNELVFQEKRQLLIVMRDMTVEKELQLSMKDAMTAAEAANQAKSDFLSRMSHEIRTPMNVIIGMLQIALNSIGDEEKMRESLKKIGTASTHLLSLINDVLDISKIESGRMVLASEPFSLESLVAQTEAVIRPQCEQRDHSFAVVVNREDDDVFVGDAVRLQQMLVNLLTNSVKYTPRGGHISLSVTVRNETTAAYRCVTIVVEDDGIGMSEEFKDRLFEPFHMEGRANAQGTGLGMSIVKNIVTMMGGDIQVRSAIDRGTTFTVTLNLRIAFEPERRILEMKGDTVYPDWTGGVSSEQGRGASSGRPETRKSSDQPKASSDEAARLPSTDLDGVRVLLAEDNELNAEIAQELLAGAGMIVDWASDGREACRMFEESPAGTYGAVLMDVQMPELNGYEATRAIRAMDRPDAKEIPIIAMSANAFAEDINASLASGMNAHLSKPINVGRVLATIAEHVGRNRSRAGGMEEQ